MTITDQIRLPLWLFLLCLAGIAGLGFAVGVSQGARAVVMSEKPIQIEGAPEGVTVPDLPTPR